jgi:hypothetical protein
MWSWAGDRCKSKIENRKSKIEMAEGVGFEPTRAFALPVFKTGAINHSTTPPRVRLASRELCHRREWEQGGSSAPPLDGNWRRSSNRPRSGRSTLRSTTVYVHVNLHGVGAGKES